MSDMNTTVDTKEKKTKNYIIILTTVLMGLIAIATAWSGYQGSNWGSKTSQNYSKANAARSDSVKDALTANQLNMLDIQIFAEWLNATAQGNTQLATFYRERMRTEAQPAFNAWLKQDPMNNPDAAKSPFTMPQYVVQKQTEADHLETLATEYSDKADEANNIGGQYVLATVILASSLFFAGLSTRFTMVKIELTFASLAFLSFGYGMLRLIALWISHGG